MLSIFLPLCVRSARPRPSSSRSLATYVIRSRGRLPPVTTGPPRLLFSIKKQLDGRCEFPTVNDDTTDLLLLRTFLPFAENGETPFSFAESSRLYDMEKLKKAIAQWRCEWELLKALQNGSSWRSDTCYLDQRLRIAKIVERRSALLRPFMETSEALVLWHEEYSDDVARSNIRKINYGLAKDIAKSENIRFAALLRSDTLRRCLLAHSRTQTLLVSSAWQSIRSHVLQEIADEKAGIIQLPLPNGWDMKVRCSYCYEKSKTRTFMGGVALHDHIRDGHPDLKDVEVMKSSIDYQTLLA